MYLGQGDDLQDERPHTADEITDAHGYDRDGGQEGVAQDVPDQHLYPG